MNEWTHIWPMPISPHSSLASGPTTSCICCDIELQFLLWCMPFPLSDIPLHTLSGRLQLYPSALLWPSRWVTLVILPLQFSQRMCSFVYLQEWTSAWIQSTGVVDFSRSPEPSMEPGTEQVLKKYSWGNWDEELGLDTRSKSKAHKLRDHPMPFSEFLWFLVSLGASTAMSIICPASPVTSLNTPFR